MKNIHLLETRRVEILARRIRGNLASLRRRKMILGSTPGARRDPSLDGFLGSMIEMRTQLLDEIAAVDALADAAYQGTPISEVAGQVLADMNEMIELLLWLGASAPAANVSAAGGATP